MCIIKLKFEGDFSMLKKILLLSLLIFIFCSCYSQKIVLNADKKSGQIIIDYELNDDSFQLLSIILDNFGSDEGTQLDPAVLIDETLFKEFFEETDDIKLKSVNITADNGYKGAIVISFKNLEKILADLPQGISGLNVERKNNSLTLSQVLNFNEIDPDGMFKEFILQQKEDDINFYNQLTKEAQFNFIIKTVMPIKYTEGVVLSKDKRKAEFSFKVNDFLINTDKILKFVITL